MKHIGFTGTQRGMTNKQKSEFTKYLRLYIDKNTNVIFHHGDCIGADTDAHEIAKKLNCKIVIHPPKNEKKRAFCKGDIILKQKDYLKRNKDIVDISEILIGAPDSPEKLRSGTWSTIRYARKSEKIIIII